MPLSNCTIQINANEIAYLSANGVDVANSYGTDIAFDRVCHELANVQFFPTLRNFVFSGRYAPAKTRRTGTRNFSAITAPLATTRPQVPPTAAMTDRAAAAAATTTTTTTWLRKI